MSNAAVGVSLSGIWLAYGLVQYPSGVCDRLLVGSVVGLLADLRGWPITFGFIGALFVSVVGLIAVNWLFVWEY